MGFALPAMLVGTAAGAAGVGGVIGPSLATAGLIGSGGAISGSLLAGLSAAGTIAGGLGAIQSSRAAAQTANYNASLAANNVTMAQQNAERAGQVGEQKAYQESIKTRAQVGAIKAEQAAKGVQVDSGSALDVRSSAAQLGQLNAITIRSNAAREAYGYQTESANFDSKNKMLKAEAANDITSGYLEAGSSILGGAAKAYDTFGNFRSSKSVIG